MSGHLITAEDAAATLAAIRALKGGAKSYSINGRMVTKRDLRELREQYQFELASLAQQGAARGNTAVIVPEV